MLEELVRVEDSRLAGPLAVTAHLHQLRSNPNSNSVLVLHLVIITTLVSSSDAFGPLYSTMLDFSICDSLEAILGWLLTKSRLEISEICGLSENCFSPSTDCFTHQLRVKDSCRCLSS